MAMSLEDLLAEEGFKRRKAKIISRTSFASEGRSSIPLRGKHESGSSLAVKKVERTRSDIPRYNSKGESSTSNSFKVRTSRDNLSKREKFDLESEKKTNAKHERRCHQDSWDVKRYSIGSLEDLRGSEIIEIVESDEIIEVGTNSQYKDIYLNKVYGYQGNEGRHSTRDVERERHKQLSGNNIVRDKKNRNNSFKHPPPMPDRRNSNDNIWKSMKHLESSDNKKFDETKNMKQPKLEQTPDTPALDEVAIKAIISILSGYIKHFLHDEDVRTSLRHNSFASLSFIGSEGSLSVESKVIENLEQAIEIVEKAAEDSATAKELKKASLQLSVITGLNSNDLKGGFTSGIPNFKLSACSHLYLSVLYVIQKKDSIAAKHLLQMFCDSPFQARKALLPDLWDRVFFPHLLHLKIWYDKASHSLADSPILTNLKLLDKVYNENLDSGTYQFALYYKEWLTEGVGAPSVPLIKIPSFSVQLMPKGGLHGHTNSPASHVSPQPMVSKKLYDEVFRHFHKTGLELEVYEDEDFEISARSSNGPAPEDKQLILYDSVTGSNIEHEPDGEVIPDDLTVAKEVHSESSSGETKLDENYGNCHWYQENSDSIVLQTELGPPTQGTRDRCNSLRVPLSIEHLNRCLSSSSNNAEHGENCEDFIFESSLLSIPKDFICPLTGLLFEDPVTLETGQTFEREAITDWFDQEFKTCPVTRKTLQYQAVPPTNLILKHVIDNWKTDHYRHLLALISQVAASSSENINVNDNMIMCILEQLVVLSGEERRMNAKRIISLGGLQFLLQRFHCGSTKEKTLILPLLLCCIEADATCRNDVARNISKSTLLELLHSEQLKTITDAVLLLTELICLNRRSGVQTFLEGLEDEEITNAMDDLLLHLQTCPLEQTPLVAVLLLQLDLLSKTHMGNEYRQEAVDALTEALERSLADEKVQKKCSRALLVLGGCFSFSGKLMTEDWILKLAGFLNGPDWDIADDEANDIVVDGRLKMVDPQTEDGDEEKAREKWLVRLSASLLEDGKKSFLEIVSKCLSLGNSDLVRVCLTTVAWLSSSLASLSDTEFQLYAFSALISPLKKCIEYGELVEQKILASLCLLNFSKFPECKVLLMKIAEEIVTSLGNLAEVTWTAKELYNIISGQGK